jgi:hypothetical protein
MARSASSRPERGHEEHKKATACPAGGYELGFGGSLNHGHVEVSNSMSPRQFASSAWF